MSIAFKAQWIIERNLGEPLALSDIAKGCGVSKYHLAHGFSARFGVSVMRYLRARRLVRAAEALSAGKTDILDLALANDYGSHEAFSRAFKSMFGLTPEQARRSKTMEGSKMAAPEKFSSRDVIKLEEPRFETLEPMLLVGLSRPQSLDETQAIASQWQQFMTHFDDIPNKKPSIPLGVTTNMDDEGRFDYVCAIEVFKSAPLPKRLIELRIPGQTYVVFTHSGHVSQIGATYSAIWNDWFPSQTKSPVEGPCLERHCKTFDPRTGMGGVEILIPVKS